MPHSGSSGFWYFISDYHQLMEIVDRSKQDTYFFLLRDNPFQLQGIASKELCDQAKKIISNDQCYLIFGLEKYPLSLNSFGSGKSFAELTEDIDHLEGKEIRIGYEPNIPTRYREEDDREDVLVLYK